MKTDKIKVVYAADIPGCTDVYWENFSYGDAAFTLVETNALLDELGIDQAQSALAVALRSIPENALVAFNG